MWDTIQTLAIMVAGILTFIVLIILMGIAFDAYDYFMGDKDDDDQDLD